MTQEALEQRFPLMPTQPSGMSYSLRERLSEQRARTLRQALEEILVCGCVSSDRRFRVEVELIINQWLEMLDCIP